MSATSELSGTAATSKGLKANALGLTSSIVIATASVAPAYSLAASLGLVVVNVGAQAPIIMPMKLCVENGKLPWPGNSS